MKKIVFLSLFFSHFLFAQTHEKKVLINFEPKFKFGPVMQINFGNNSFSKDYRNELGFGMNLSVVRIRKFSFGVGYDYAKLSLLNKEIIGEFSHVNSSSFYSQVEYSFNYNQNIDFNPSIGYASVMSNFIESSNLIAKQYGNEIRLGTTVDYKLNRVYSLFFGCNYGYYFNHLDASSENQNYFGQSHKIQFSLGFEIN